MLLQDGRERSTVFVVPMGFDATCAAFADYLDTHTDFFGRCSWNSPVDGLKIVRLGILIDEIVDVPEPDTRDDMDELTLDLLTNDVEIHFRTLDSKVTSITTQGWPRLIYVRRFYVTLTA